MIAITTIDDFSVIKLDGLKQSVGFDIFLKFCEFGTRHEREEARDLVKLVMHRAACLNGLDRFGGALQDNMTQSAW